MSNEREVAERDVEESLHSATAPLCLPEAATTPDPARSLDEIQKRTSASIAVEYLAIATIRSCVTGTHAIDRSNAVGPAYYPSAPSLLLFPTSLIRSSLRAARRKANSQEYINIQQQPDAGRVCWRPNFGVSKPERENVREK